MDFDDFMPSPNIVGDPELYAAENRALLRDGRLDAGLRRVVDFDGAVMVDIGCGTGFWLDKFGECAEVIGVEPDERLRPTAALAGSAEQLPLPDASADICLARFAYFFGPGAEAGVAEALRVLRPGGKLVVIDNGPGAVFGRLLEWSDVGNGALDPQATERFWQDLGAERHLVDGGWQATDAAELEAILRLEFPAEVVDRHLAEHGPSASIDITFAVYVLQSA